MSNFALAMSATGAKGLVGKLGPKQKATSPENLLGAGPVRKTVHNIVEDFQWAEYNLSVVDEMLTPGADDKTHWGSPTGIVMGDSQTTAAKLVGTLMQGKTISYAYAGIDAPGTSLIMTSVAAQDKGHDAPKPTALWAIEYDKACITELGIAGSDIDKFLCLVASGLGLPGASEN